MRVRRALLYMPGSDQRKIEKAASLGVDSACLDLEDGVAANRKAEAPEMVAHALQTLNFGKTEKLGRNNAVGTGLEADELSAVLTTQPDGIIVPKVSDADEIRWVSEAIGRAERSRGWQPGAIGLIMMIESARGLGNFREIATADARLDALIFGADIGATRTPDGLELLYARSAIATHCAAFG